MTSAPPPRVGARVYSRAARLGYRLLLQGVTLGGDRAGDMRLLLRMLAWVDEIRHMIRDDLGRAAVDLHRARHSYAQIGVLVGQTARQVQDHLERGRTLHPAGCAGGPRCTCQVDPADERG